MMSFVPQTSRLRVVLFTRGLKPRLRHPSSERCLRAVRFTRVLKRRAHRWRQASRLRAVRFTRVLKPTNAPAELPGCLRAVRFTLGAFNCPPTPTAGWTIMHFTRPRSFQVLAYLRTAQASQCLMSGAAYESTQTKKQCEKCSHCFESCAIYKGAQYGGYQQWKQNQFESCIVFKGFQSAQDNAQVCVQVLFTRPPTLIPFAPLLCPS